MTETPEQRIERRKAAAWNALADRCSAPCWITPRAPVVECVCVIAVARAIEASDAAVSPWRPIAEAPRDGTKFWGKVGEDAIAMFWHEGFGEFVSSYRQMSLASGYTFEDGSTSRDHSPDIHRPTHFMPMPPDPPGDV